MTTTLPILTPATLTPEREDAHRRLMNAAMMGELAKVKKILREDPTIYKAIDGQTVSFPAVNSGRHDVVRFLLEEMPASAEDKAVLARGNANMPPLVRSAIERHDTDTVNLLLKYDASCTFDKSKEGMSLLMLALFYSQAEAAQTLLDRGADPLEYSTSYNRNCLHWASYSSLAGIKLIYPHTSHMLEVPDDRGYTPLIAAANASNPESVQFFLDQKANVLAIDNTGNTAIHRSIGNMRDHDNDAEAVIMITALLKAGAPIDAQNNKGETALMHAEQLGLYKTTAMLLAHGANAALIDKSGKTMMDHIATDNIDRRADVQSMLQEIAAQKQREEIAVAIQTALKGTATKTPVMRKIVLRRAP